MRALATVLLIVGVAGRAWAQQPADPPPPDDKQPAAETATVDATKLGISISRIRQGLFIKESTRRDGLSPLHLEFQVQVYGQAPKIDVLKGADLFGGQVPGSAPTHNQMIDFWTPQQYSAPALPVSALMFWFADQMWKKSKKSACEQAIDDYKAMLMQGINVSAPRCTQ